MFTKEQLIASGLSEEQATAVLKLHKEALDGNYVAKHRFDEVNGELKTTKEQLTERDTQITGLKKFEGTAKELQDKINLLEADNAKKVDEYKKGLALERKRNVVKLALLEDENGKPHDVDMVMGLFDLDQINIDEATGKISSGFKEQSDKNRKDKPFLFSAKQEPGKPGTPGWKPAGATPPDGSEGGGKPDEAMTYGKSLAQIKLGMMGIKPAEPPKQ